MDRGDARQMVELGAARRAFRRQTPRYVAQFIAWLAIFALALTALGHKRAISFPPSSSLHVLGRDLRARPMGQGQHYNLEPPLVALVVGLADFESVGLPRWIDAGFRVEFYVKTGIVLLGATLPFTLIVWAGPVAILQASIVSIATFLVIYWSRDGSGSTSGSPRRSARAARSAASRPRSPSPARSAPRRSMRRSPSPW